MSRDLKLTYRIVLIMLVAAECGATAQPRGLAQRGRRTFAGDKAP
jgi:hypothetical protein